MNCKRCESENLVLLYETEFHDIYKCCNCEFEQIEKIEDCCRNPFIIIVNDSSFMPNYRLYRQCVRCGGCKRNFPVKYTSDIDIDGEFELYRLEEYRENVSFDKKLIYESVSYSNYLTSPKGKYHQYLFTPEWKEKRELAFQRDNYTCQECKKHPAIHAHHLTYDRIYHEKIEDLQSVCAECHAEIHHRQLIDRINKLRNNRK